LPTVTLKLFALLGARLPKGAQANSTSVTLGDDSSVAGVIAGYGLDEKDCHLVLLNGNFIAAEARAATKVTDGDTISIWPPIGGG
jgi:sulfur carrier protein ThiS